MNPKRRDTASLLASFALALSIAGIARESPAGPHPLDPLSLEEIRAATGALAEAGHVDEDTRFPWLTIVEPPKGDVLAGKETPRHAFAVLKQGPRTFEAVVDVAAKKVLSWKEIPGVQPSILLEELLAITDIVKADEKWQRAMRARGYESFDGIVCMPLSTGNYGVEEERGRRLVRVPCFDGRGVKNYWGRPIEGLTAVADLNERTVVKIVETGAIPVPDAPVDYHPEALESVRAPAPPLAVTQPKGAGFSFDGHEVRWQRWRFHLRNDPRAGLVLSLVRWQDGDGARSILYQGHVAELFVPYMDPDLGWYFRTYMDMGEYGVGKLASTLVPGGDCPRHAAFLGDVLPDDRGQPVERERIVCLFERETGDIAWRHYDFIAEETESRAARELVVRQVATIGNYDYVFDWIFHLNGTIRVAVGATGIDEVKAVTVRSAADEGAGEASAYGRFVAPNTVAVNHDHFFSFRLDFDVDGATNSFVHEELRRARPKSESPRKSVWRVDSKRLASESEARLHMRMDRPAIWRVVNPGVRGPAGDFVSYELKPGHNAMSLLDADDPPAERAAFTGYQLWVTPYDPDERWSAGAYPNQAKGGQGLPAWTARNRRIDQRDIVLWYTLGFHHVVRPEDWPVLPTSWHEFELRPFGFFARNPALDLPRAP